MNLPEHSQTPRRWNLKSLKFFETCARAGSFFAAADELCVSQSAVSKQIKNLEDGLGFALFIRDTKVASLTRAGEKLAAHLSNLFLDLDLLIEDLSANKISAPLVISCEPTVCLKLLIPCLSDIEQQTGVSIQVLSAGGPVNFRRDHADLAIRRNDFPLTEQLHVLPIGEEYVGPVLAADATHEAATIRIHAQTRADAWLNWQRQHCTESFAGDVYHQHHFSALEAAESGQGAALMSIHMVSRLLEQKRLVAPYGFVSDGSEYVCLSESPFALDERKQLICQWLQQRFSENNQRARAINSAIGAT